MAAGVVATGVTGRGIETGSRWIVQREVRRLISLVMLVLVVGLSACERETPSPPPPNLPAAAKADLVPLPATKPRYSFAPGLAEQHPEVVAFMRHFLETCLAGDYQGYRRLVARVAEPESRSRFERILHSLQSLAVESIEPITLPTLTAPAYVVVGEAGFTLDERVARYRRKGPRRIAVLVLEEDGEWRMTLAPAELQPVSEEEEPTSAPTTTSAPSFPWDEDGDY